SARQLFLAMYPSPKCHARNSAAAPILQSQAAWRTLESPEQSRAALAFTRAAAVTGCSRAVTRWSGIPRLTGVDGVGPGAQDARLPPRSRSPFLDGYIPDRLCLAAD